MPRRYLLTTGLLSVCDHVVLLYVVRRTVTPLYGGPNMAFPFPWRRPSANHWDFVGDGITIRKAGKLRRLGCVGLCRVRLVMWLAKRG